ncbi:hypothetical protein HAX54_039310 [Datura stramonium]|uniref:Uncharacterized protein n=1 Tax=Datura stramonium TaxID=4076 RepID=A0ABS8VL56_DATST|nr:hypothetical protein [Datura stramonium]
MAPKVNKGKGVAFSSHGHKRSKRGQETLVEDARLDVMKTKEPEGIHGSMLSISERNTCFDNVLSLLYGMQMLQLRISRVMKEQLQPLNMDYLLSEHSRSLCRAWPGFKEPFDNDNATDEEKARVDSGLESDGDDGDYSEMRKAAYAPTDD